MKTQNVVIIAATLFSLSAIANAATQDNQQQTQTTQGGFSLGFASSDKSSSQKAKRPNEQTTTTQSKLTKKTTRLALGFNSDATSTHDESNSNVGQLVNVQDKPVIKQKKAREGFNIGFNS